MIYACQTINSTSADYWNKILQIKKKRSNFLNPAKVYLKILITSNETTGNGEEKRECFLEIEQQCFQNKTSDTNNTFIKCNNPYDIKIKAYEDSNNVYIYAQCHNRQYGNSLFINVLEEKGDIRRVKYFYQAKFDLLPSDKTEIPIIIEGKSKIMLRTGEDGSKKAQTVAKFTIKKNSNYLQIKFKINSNSTSSPLYGVFDLFLGYNYSSKSQQNRLRVEGGTSMSIFLTTEENDTEYIYTLYSCIMATGRNATFEILECANLNSANFTMFPKYAPNIDLSTLTKSIRPVRNNIIVGTMDNNQSDIASNGKIKYGEINFDGSSTDMTVKFNTPFNYKCLSIQLTGAWKSDNSISYVISELEKDHFKVHLTGGKSITLYYLAIGY